MRSLFGKLFLSFILITLLASIATAMISYWARIGPYGEVKRRLQYQQYRTLVHTLSLTGLAVAKILETGGEKDVISYLLTLEKTDDDRIFLLKSDNSTLSGRSLPLIIEDLASAARYSKAIQHNISETEMTVAMPLNGIKEGSFVIIGTMARISWPPALTSSPEDGGLLGQSSFHIPLGLPLLVMVLVAAAGCYLLARSLTAPIRHLRTAVQRMTKGDFSARIVLPRHSVDEIADLSRDFNIMIERIETLLQSQKRLLRDISHELRSPLTRMNVSLQLVRQQRGNAELYLLRIEKESNRLNELIGQLLTLTRLESDVDNAPKEPVDLPELVRTIIHDADFEAVALNRKIEVQTLDDVTVLGSMEMLGRALENVVRNGLRYTAAGTAVEISLIKKEEDSVAVLLVRDHGPGVADEYLDQIFKPFFRVAESRNRDSGGTGIGLAVARQAILMHGGSIKAKNNPAGGLIVEMHLPVL